MYKILVTGNGFDLAHNLPTSYGDFIEFINILDEKENEEINIKNFLEEKTKGFYNIDQIDILQIIESYKKLFEDEESNLSIYGRGLLNYFKNKKENNIKGWVDFENEIKEISETIKEIVEIESNGFLSYEGNSIYITKKNMSNIIGRSQDYLTTLYENFNTYFSTKGISFFLENDATKEKYIYNPKLFDYKNIMEDFHLAVKCLEKIFNWYITRVINELMGSCNGTPDNEILKEAKYQINFNYTNLVNYMYQNKEIQEKISFIHGRANYNATNTNLLFGYNFNELMDKYQRPLSKVFKRIDYNTDYNVLEKLKQNQIPLQGVEIIFWGHSLDKTDEDIIVGIFRLLNKNYENKITIYYHNDISKFNMLNNLFEILEKEEIEKYTSKGRLNFMKSPEVNMIKGN